MKAIYTVLLTVLAASLISINVIAASDSDAGIMRKSIVVLDFENSNKDDKELSWLSAGMAEAILTKLRNIKSLRLIERKQVLKAIEELNFSASDYFDKEKSGKLADFLRADIIIVGSFQEFRGKIRIFARFVDLKTTEVIDAAEVKGDLDSIFDLQDQIALQLMDKMGVVATQEEKDKVVETVTESLSAYEYYSKAISLPGETEEKFQEKIALFKKAIEEDPKYKEAYNDLAVLYIDRKNYAEALEYLKKAIQVDLKYPFAHYNIGLCYENMGDYKAAMESYKICIDIEPEYLPTYFAISEVAEKRGMKDEAQNYIKKLLEKDPANAPAYNQWGEYFLQCWRIQRIVGEIRKGKRI